MKLSEYLKENIFNPLGMKDTGFYVTDSVKKRLATMYDYDEKLGVPKIIPSEFTQFNFGTEYESGGAGLLSTVDDYILLSDALASGGVGKSGERILSKYGVDLMRANALKPEHMKGFNFSHCKGYGYGYGVRCLMDPSPYGITAPIGEFGWDGWKLCYTSSSPETGISMFHAEHMGEFHSLVVPRLRNLLYSCIGE
jgi:CubicO group peptidase (beta-lactamase class C family)